MKPKNLLRHSLPILLLLCIALLAHGIYTGKFCSFLPCNLPQQTKIISTSSISVIEKQIQDLSRDTLLVFDVDDVLISATDQLLTYPYKKYLMELTQEAKSSLPPETIAKLTTIVLKTRKVALVEPKILEFIRRAQAKGAKIIALTHAGAGSYGAIQSFADWRINELKSLGIDFSDSFQDFFREFKELKGKFGSPVFKQGILFTGKVDKGTVLGAFLHSVSFCPRKIVFVDDRLENVKSVERFCQDKKISDYQVVEYTAIKSRSFKPLNEKRARFQVSTLLELGQWLSDQEADEKLSNNPAFGNIPKSG